MLCLFAGETVLYEKPLEMTCKIPTSKAVWHDLIKYAIIAKFVLIIIEANRENFL